MQRIDSSYLARYILLNAVDISDYQVFPEREVQNRSPTFHFAPANNHGEISSLLNQALPIAESRTADAFPEENGATACSSSSVPLTSPSSAAFIFGAEIGTGNRSFLKPGLRHPQL